MFLLQGEKMHRKTQHSGLGTALVFAGLLVFTACKQPGGNVGDPTSQVEITGIPPQTSKGADSFKIFVQFSKGTSADAGYVAKGDALIEGADSVIMELKNPDGESWSGSGTFNVAIVLSPATVTNWEDIDVRAGQNVVLSSETKRFVWTDEQLINLSGSSLSVMTDRVKQIFNGGSTGKPGIICVPESGIEYPDPSP
jgi:hypothetical protein